MPRVGFEHTTPIVKRANALDRAATVIGGWVTIGTLILGSHCALHAQEFAALSPMAAKLSRGRLTASGPDTVYSFRTE
jgi:hypothetical protein